MAAVQRSHFPNPYTRESNPRPSIPRESSRRDRIKRPREEGEEDTASKRLWKPPNLSCQLLRPHPWGPQVHPLVPALHAVIFHLFPRMNVSSFSFKTDYQR